MYKNEREWLAGIQKDDLTGTVDLLQTLKLPDVPVSTQLPQIRRRLLTRHTNNQSWLSLLNRTVGTVVSISLLLLLVVFFWLNQANQSATSPSELETRENLAAEPEPDAIIVPALPLPEIITEEVVAEGEAEPGAAVLPEDHVWWLAIRRQLTDRDTNLTPYEIEVGYQLESVDTAVAQLFLAPQPWQSAADLYPFSEPVTISAEEDSVTFSIAKDLEQFFQEIPSRANSLVIALSGTGVADTFLVTDSWKNFVDTEYFAGTIFITPASDSALNVFDWEFDNDFFTVESPPRRFGGTEIVTFVVNYHYQLTQTPRAYIKLVLVDKTNGNRPLDSAFVRADAGVGLITAFLEFDPSLVDGRTNLAIESFVMREGLESPGQTASGWVYEPAE